MSLKFRRFLYIIFIAAFLVVAPLVCLYAAGYKIGSGFSVQKTGILILNTRPKGAKIYINQKPRQLLLKKYYAPEKSYIKTPAKIKGLLPGEYGVSLELEGYWPWQKKLAVRPGETTFAENIMLFKNDMPVILDNGRYESVSQSPDKRRIALANGEKIVSFDLESEEEEVYRRPTSTGDIAAMPDEPVWSPDGKRLLAGGEILTPGRWDNPAELAQIVAAADKAAFGTENGGKTPSDCSWDAGDAAKAYCRDGNRLYRYDLAWGSVKLIFDQGPFEDYLVKGGWLYLVSQKSQSSELNIYNLDDNAITSSIGLPKSSYGFFADPDGGRLSLYDRNYGILYLIDPFSAIKPLRDSVNNVKSAVWIDGYRLLYANDFEVWIYDARAMNKTILTRISQRINSAIIHPNGHYVIFATDKAVYTIELDGREKYNTAKLIELEAIGRPYLDKKGDRLYFYAEIGSQSGLYKLFLQ